MPNTKHRSPIRGVGLIALHFGVAIGLAYPACATAQNNQAEQILRGVLGNINKGKQGSAAPSAPTGLPELSELVDNKAPKKEAVKPLYANKETALAAAEAGEFVFGNRLEEKERSAIRSTLLTIFKADYGIARVPQGCYDILTNDSIKILSSIAKLNMATLTKDGLDFYQPTENMGFAKNELRDTLAEQTNEMIQNEACDKTVMGRVQLSPYRAALVKFSQEYAKSIQVYVKTERSRRKQAYEVAQADARQAQQQRADDERKVTQQRFDAENKRVQDEQNRRARIERAKVGG